MLRNLLSPVLKTCNNTTFRYSALYINSLKASKTYVFVTPHVDYPDVDRDMLKQNLERRKLTFNLQKLEDIWSFYGDLKQRKNDYDKKRAELSKELTNLIKSDPANDQINKLKIQNDLIKDNIKKLKTPLWSAEYTAMVEALKLPNSLHQMTPDNTKTIVNTFLMPPTEKIDHLTMAKDLDILKFKKNENYYLKGDAAIFELGAKFFFSKVLKNNKYIQFSNPDFVKSLVVEGCARDHTSSDATFILHHNEDDKVNIDNRLHLTGGGSLSSFMAYHAKNVIPAKNLPLKYFSLGRQYVPASLDEDSLFHVSQSSVVKIFCATKDSSQQEDVLKELISIVTELYTAMGYHFQLSYTPADKLFHWESLRLSIEMYSTSLGNYVEVGNVSVSGHFISKRLMFTYIDKKEGKFPYLLSGTILNVPKLLGCVLEHNEGFELPKQLRVENWSV